MSEGNTSMTSPDQNEGVWVQSEAAPDGTYVIGFHCGPDRAWVLNRDDAILHAMAVATQAERAEYDAAILAVFHGQLGLPLESAVPFLTNDIRPDRPPVEDPSELTVSPGVSQDGEIHGFLHLHLDGQIVGQWTLDAARSYAGDVLQAVAAVDNDAVLHRVLVGKVCMDDEKARQIIEKLGQHRVRGDGR